MNYSEAMNIALLESLGRQTSILAFGQNIGAGSHLSGLTRGINDVVECEVFNTPNCENAEIGFGFGLMLEGAKCIFIVKQQDFLLLGLDQLVNTANVAVGGEGMGSFTVAFVTVDSGYEGPQSRLNQFAEICSLSGQPGYTVSSRQEAEFILGHQVGAPGFRMIGFSQRLFREEVIHVPDARLLDAESGATCFVEAGGVVIVACNFALPQALLLAEGLRDVRNLACSVVSVPRVDSPMSESLAKYLSIHEKVAVLDDSHSRMGAGRLLVSEAVGRLCDASSIALFDRSGRSRDITPNGDAFEVPLQSVVEKLML